MNTSTYKFMITLSMKKISIYTLALALMVLPGVAAAQFGGINDFIGDISSFINGTLIPLVFAVALLVFIYGIFKYFILGGGDEDSREEGKKLMVYAIVGFVIMVSVFGIVNLIAGGLGFSDDQDIQNIPNVPSNNR
ncbi:MAG: hypothetical protein ACI9H6_000623 [Patiriisocius sp.]|jgi:hypothetical protein